MQPTRNYSHLQKILYSGVRAFGNGPKNQSTRLASRPPQRGVRGARAAMPVRRHEDDASTTQHQAKPTLKFEKQTFTPAPQISEAEMLSAIFAKDSTYMLIKKFFVYKLMGSNLFINHSLGLMNIAYKIFGIRLTNFAINKSVGSLFTSGETIQTLV